MANAIRYQIILYWSQDDQAFIAEVPELPGCAADGASYQESLANAEVTIREWIETARQSGRPVPEPRGRLDPQEDDNLIDELLASDPKFQALLKKSKAGPRKPFALGDNEPTNG